MILMLFLLQAATPAVARSPERFSILVDPCASARDDQGNDIVVCGQTDAITPRIPLPQFRGPPNHAMPSNPDLKASVALDGAGIGNECGDYGEDCPVGLGGPIIPALVSGAVDAVRSAFAKRSDKRGRVPIPLNTPTTGKILP